MVAISDDHLVAHHHVEDHLHPVQAADEAHFLVAVTAAEAVAVHLHFEEDAADFLVVVLHQVDEVVAVAL